MPNGNFQIVSTMERFTVVRKPTSCLSIPTILCLLEFFCQESLYQNAQCWPVPYSQSILACWLWRELGMWSGPKCLIYWENLQLRENIGLSRSIVDSISGGILPFRGKVIYADDTLIHRCLLCLFVFPTEACQKLKLQRQSSRRHCS